MHTEEENERTERPQWKSWGQHEIWNIQKDTKQSQRCRQIKWVMVPLVKCVSRLPTPHISIWIMYQLFLTTMQSWLWLVESHMLLDFCVFHCLLCPCSKRERKVSAWDNSPLCKDSSLACWDPNWSQRWPLSYWEAFRTNRSLSLQRPLEGYRVCGVLWTHTERPEERVWWRDPGCPTAGNPRKGCRCVLLWTSRQSPLPTAGVSTVLKAMFNSSYRWK